MSGWHSLYLKNADPQIVADNLRALLTAHGYALYNPFSLMPVKPYKRTVRMFVAPAPAEWTRLVGEPDAALLPELARSWPLVWLSLTGPDVGIQTFVDGDAISADTFPDVDASALAQALVEVPLTIVEKTPSALPLDALPPDVKALTIKVDPKKANKMFEQLSGTLLKRAGGEVAAARMLLEQQDAPDWDGVGGARLQAVARAFGLPDDWQSPDFVAVRDAYQAHVRRQRRPDAPLFPGDAEALAVVSDVSLYVPIFGGRDD
ncbi:MAG: hypothetical protein KJ065_02805 [Anaerolineae bacterium]|nr:hypothetical protein [Anaerolineae bacterium]